MKDYSNLEQNKIYDNQKIVLQERTENLDLSIEEDVK